MRRSAATAFISGLMKSNRVVAFELQQLLIEAGLDVDLAPYQNSEVGKTDGYDLRVMLEDDGRGGFLDRLIVTGNDPDRVTINWTLSRDWPTVIPRDKLENIFSLEPMPTALRAVRQQELRKIARSAYQHIEKNSTSDSPQAKA